LERHDRVAALCPNVPALLELHHAVPEAGGVLVAINVRLSPDEIRYATRALAELLAEVPGRPIHARVADHNLGSIRVLAKCGFSIVGEELHDGAPVKEIVMRLDA
jgi:acyl-CoA synthetase (AMP-forming)/AMP-acid ligase II